MLPPLFVCQLSATADVTLVLPSTETFMDFDDLRTTEAVRGEADVAIFAFAEKVAGK